MTGTTGYGENAAVAALEVLTTGGLKIHLYGAGTTAAYSDGATDITNKSDMSMSVNELDLTINTPLDFSGIATITNDNELTFSNVNIGVVDHVVLQNQTNTELWTLADEIADPNTTGEDIIISAGSTLYEFGNPV